MAEAPNIPGGAIKSEENPTVISEEFSEVPLEKVFVTGASVASTGWGEKRKSVLGMVREILEQRGFKMRSEELVETTSNGGKFEVPAGKTLEIVEIGGNRLPESAWIKVSAGGIVDIPAGAKIRISKSHPTENAVEQALAKQDKVEGSSRKPNENLLKDLYDRMARRKGTTWDQRMDAEDKEHKRLRDAINKSSAQHVEPLAP